MQMRKTARALQGRIANMALRMPISWVHLAAGPPAVVDGRTLDDGFLLTRLDMEWFREQYLDGLAQAADTRVSPLLAADLSGLPPALVFTQASIRCVTKDEPMPSGWQDQA